MQINLLFEGSVRERYKQQVLANTGIAKEPLANKLKEIEMERDGKAFTLTLSNEVRTLKAESDEELAQIFARSVNPDPTDIFSYRPQDQWVVFSQYLNDTGFFDGKDVGEIEEIENLLVDITDGMDNLHIATQHGRDIKKGSKPITQELTNAEAQLELASSTSALKIFSEKFVMDDIKEGFNQLIEQYTKRNENRVMNYASIEEKFYKGRAKIFETRGMDTSTLNLEQKKNLSITNKLGKTNYTEAEISQMIEGYKEKFSMLQNALGVDELISQLQEELSEFVTKGISKQDKDNEYAKNFVKEKSAKTFERIADYWKKLLD